MWEYLKSKILPINKKHLWIFLFAISLLFLLLGILLFNYGLYLFNDANFYARLEDSAKESRKFLYGIILMIMSLGIMGPSAFSLLILTYLCIAYTTNHIVSSRLMNYYHSLGYHWVDQKIASKVYQHFIIKKYTIPRSDDMEAIPGFTQDAEGLIKYTTLYHNHQQYIKEVRAKEEKRKNHGKE